MTVRIQNIKSFVKNWLDSKANAPSGDRKYILSSEFDPANHSFNFALVLTQNQELAEMAPESDSYYLRVVLANKLTPEECSKMSQLRCAPVYLLVVSKEGECAFDCYQRAYYEMMGIPSIFNLQCIIVTALIDNTRQIVFLSSLGELKKRIQKLHMELNWKIFTNELPDFPDAPISSRELSPIKPLGKLWLIQISQRKHSIFLPKILLSYLWKQNRAVLVQSIFQNLSVVHFYQPSEKGHTLEQIFQVPSDIGLKYHFPPKKTQSNNPTGGLRQTIGDYYCYDIPANISWSKANILAWLENSITQSKPGLVIIDINVDLMENDHLQKTIKTLFSQGVMVWFCSPSEASRFPLVTDCNIEVTGVLDGAGDIFFKAKINSSNRFLFQSNQIMLTQHKLVEPQGEDAKNIESIRQMEAAKTPDKIMADKLGVNINTIRQIKKKNKIRTNLPLKNKRRQGLNKKVEKLYDKMQKKDYPVVRISSPGSHPNPFWPNEKQIKEIAVKVGRAPSYVKKTLKIMLARRYNRSLD